MEDSATDNQVKSLVIDDAAQIDLAGTTMCSSTNATGETAIEQQSETVIPVDKQANHGDSKIENMEKNISFSNKRVAKRFRVLSSNKSHQGKVNKIFFGTVENPISGKDDSWKILYDDGDVDVFSRAAVLDAIKYYDRNKDYDKLFRNTLANGEKGGNNTVTKVGTSVVATTIRKASAPKKKEAKVKVKRKEPVPIWTGPPDEEISGGWPEGWVKKVFVRHGGATKGQTDRYWFSPKENYRLRSMKQVRKFLTVLAENGGDEKKAKKAIGRS